MKTKRFPGLLNALICVFFIVFGLFIAIGPVEAFSVEEHFDSYNLGPISGQGGWTGNGGEVSDDIVGTSGYKTLKLSAFNSSNAIIEFSSSTDLQISFNLYAQDFPNDQELFFDFNLLSGGFKLRTRLLNGLGSFNYETGDNRTSLSIVCPNFPFDTWYNIRIDAGSGGAKYSCNNGPWTFTLSSEGYGVANGNYFEILGGSYSDNIIVYLDDLEITGQGIFCDEFESRTDCIAGGCFWENIIFHEEYSYCRDLVVGEEGFCEYSIFGCAYCNSSTTCAGATGCYWNGLAGCSYLENVCEFEHLENCENSTDCENASGTWNGDFCFVSNIGPVDCSSMNLLERLVCEIKNFISTAFLPSKAKLTELGQTIDLINTKFPSNYLRAGRLFFDNVKNGINESEGIPVKILGHEQDISFDIFNATGSAGVVGTLGNFLKVFFNLVFITIFITWALSFLKRIFK